MCNINDMTNESTHMDMVKIMIVIHIQKTYIEDNKKTGKIIETQVLLSG